MYIVYSAGYEHWTLLTWGWFRESVAVSVCRASWWRRDVVKASRACCFTLGSTPSHTITFKLSFRPSLGFLCSLYQSSGLVSPSLRRCEQEASDSPACTTDVPSYPWRCLVFPACALVNGLSTSLSFAVSFLGRAFSHHGVCVLLTGGPAGRNRQVSECLLW